MKSSHSRALLVIALLTMFSGCMFFSGCSQSPPTEKSASTAPKKPVVEEEVPPQSEPPYDQVAQAIPAAEPVAKKRKKFAPIDLDGKSTPSEEPSADASGASPAKNVPNERQTAAVVAALQPFQVMLGQWRWTTNKKFGGFAKSGEDMDWIWDFKTDRSQPALTFHTDKHPYFHAGSLTYIADADKFRLTTESPQGDKRVFEGTWAEGGEPKETFEGKKSERSYKLELTQIEPAEGELWRVVMNQQDNNRYLFELKRKAPKGTQFGTLDTVASQRLGTSFAAVDSDNPGPKCIISGGLGTMSVSYKGKSYPVCCTGCVAAFNDDPERWLAKLAKSEAANKKMAE